MGKRGNHEGSIWKLKDGSGFKGCVRLGFDATGKPIRKWVTRQRKDEVQNELRDLATKFASNIPITNAKLTVAKHMDDWLKIQVEPNVGPGTLENYTQHVRAHINPLLGKVVLVKLNGRDIQKFMNNLMALTAEERRKLDPIPKRQGGTHTEYLSAATVRQTYKILRTGLDRAVKWGLIPFNPALNADPPQTAPDKKFEPTPLNLKQAEALLRVLDGHRLEALFITSCVGLRKGELLGLRRDAISWNHDFTLGTLRVTKSLKKVKGVGRVMGDVKTPNSIRSIDLPPFVIKALVRRLEIQEQERVAAGDKWIENGLIFTKPNGDRLNMNEPNDMLDKALEKAGVDHIRVHDLRHTAATLLILKGVHPRVVSAILGHASFNFTMQVYGHLIQEMRDQAKAAWTDMFPTQRVVNERPATPKLRAPRSGPIRIK
jgi:integrase